MDLKFKEKYGPWGVVTGASDGIGKAIAIELADKGLNLVLVARRKDDLEKLATQISDRKKVEVKVVALDLSVHGANQELYRSVEGYDVGLLAAVAGFGTSGPFVNTDLGKELNMIDLNCRSVVEQCHLFAKKFVTKKKGGIILLGSLVGFQGTPNAANYAATKAFIQTFAEGLNIELKAFGVDVISSAPGPVASGFATRANMTMGGAATPEQVARPTVNALGKAMTIRPGFLAKFLGWSLMLLNRWSRIKDMESIMGEMTKHQQR